MLYKCSKNVRIKPQKIDRGKLGKASDAGLAEVPLCSDGFPMLHIIASNRCEIPHLGLPFRSTRSDTRVLFFFFYPHFCAWKPRFTLHSTDMTTFSKIIRTSKCARALLRVDSSCYTLNREDIVRNNMRRPKQGRSWEQKPKKNIDASAFH